jgi:hypothetical protein
MRAEPKNGVMESWSNGVENQHSNTPAIQHSARWLLLLLCALAPFLPCSLQAASITVTGQLHTAFGVVMANTNITFTPKAPYSPSPGVLSATTRLRVTTDSVGGFSINPLPGTYEVQQPGTPMWLMAVGTNAGTFWWTALSTTAALPPDHWPVMQGATEDYGGVAGLVPFPPAGATNRYLSADGQWRTPPEISGGGDITNLNDLTDVTLGTPANVQLLSYLGASGTWTNFDGDSRWLTISSAASSYQPLDADLTGWSTTPTNVLTAKLSTTDAAAAYQPLDADLTGWSATPTNVLTAKLSTTDAATAYQPLDADLTGWSTTSTNVLSDKQPASANLTNWSSLPTNILGSATASPQVFPIAVSNQIPSALYSAWPRIARQTNGDIYIAYKFAALHSGPTPRATLMVKSEDDGKTWGAPLTIYTNGTTDNAYFSFGISPSGRMIQMNSSQANPSAIYGRATYQYSDDNGSTWSVESNLVSIAQSGLNLTNLPFGEITTLASNRLITGYYSYGSGVTNGSMYALLSDDNGVSWTTNLVATSTTLGLMEPSFACLGDSNILCLIRANGGSSGGAFATSANMLYQARSTNNGASWVQDGLVSLGYVGSYRGPVGLAAWTNSAGVRVGMAFGNRDIGRLEFREAGARELFSGNTNVWSSADVEDLGEICPYVNDGGYPSVLSKGSGDLLISYYWSPTNNWSAPVASYIRTVGRSQSGQLFGNVNIFQPSILTGTNAALTISGMTRPSARETLVKLGVRDSGSLGYIANVTTSDGRFGPSFGGFTTNQSDVVAMTHRVGTDAGTVAAIILQAEVVPLTTTDPANVNGTPLTTRPVLFVNNTGTNTIFSIAADGVVGFKATNAPPSVTATPAGWMTVTVGGVTYKTPLYQ